MAGEAASFATRDATSFTARRSWLPRWLSSEHPFPWLFPASALMIVFGIYPLLYAIWLSLQRKHPVTRKLTLRAGFQLDEAAARRARLGRDGQHLHLHRHRASFSSSCSAC
jgi:ABC-type sugar transport system permease subunit